jgi:arsenate reductase
MPAAGILVLCTGNSARSQMAEAFLRDRVDPDIPVYSAGTEPAERINPLTVEVMAEAGFDLAERKPRHLREYLGRVPVRTVIIVCDGAAKSCPAIWPGAFERLLWPFEDPAALEGSYEERLAKFRQVRDAIDERVREWVDQRQLAKPGGRAAAPTPQ